MSAQSNDQVFQLSLTEIAFMIIFILLILFGFMVFKATKENKALQATIANSAGLEERQKTLEKVTADLKSHLSAIGVKDPDAMLSKLVEASKDQEEAGRLKVLVEQKDKELSALTEVEKALAQAAPDQKGEEAKKAVIEAVLTFNELKKLLQEKNQESPSAAADVIKRVGSMKATEQVLSKAFGKEGQSPTDQQLQEMVQNANDFTQTAKTGSNPLILKKDNADLRGQVLYLQNRLNARGGIDYPPCWVDEATGKIQYLFTLELRDSEIQVESAWPAARQDDAMALPGMQNLLNNRLRRYEDFMAGVKAISEQSKAKECRFYVRLKSVIQDAVQSDRKRLLVETVFYKSEVRR